MNRCGRGEMVGQRLVLLAGLDLSGQRARRKDRQSARVNKQLTRPRLRDPLASEAFPALPERHHAQLQSIERAQERRASLLPSRFAREEGRQRTVLPVLPIFSVTVSNGGSSASPLKILTCWLSRSTLNWAAGRH